MYAKVSIYCAINEYLLIDGALASTSNHSKQILIGNFKTQSHDLCKELFCSQVFHTTSNVLNVDVNIVNIALIAFCSPVVAKSARWPMSSLLSCQSIVCYSCRLFKLCFD